MSQLASAYLVTEKQLGELNEISKSEDWDGFHELLNAQATTVKPEYGYSGHVIGVLLAFLDEKGISIAASRSEYPELDGTCVNPVEARAAADALLTLETTDEELETFFEGFTGIPFKEAPEAMFEGMEFLRTGCEQAAAKSCYLLLIIG